MGPWAVDLALSVGIFPYILKLLQTTSTDLRPTLVFIWCKVLALDKSCQSDLIKDNGHHYFIKYLDSADGTVNLYSRAQASFVLCVICDRHPKGQALCAASNLLAVLLKWLRNLFPPQVPFATPGHPLLLKWLCLCLGKLCQDMPEISLMAIREGAADLLVQLLTVASPDIRAGAVFGLGCLIHSCPEVRHVVPFPCLHKLEWVSPDSHFPLVSQFDPNQVQDHPLSMVPTEDRLPAEQLIANAVRQVVYDPSVLVRCELAVLYARFVRGHAAAVGDSLTSTQRKLNDFLRSQQGAQSSRKSMDMGQQPQPAERAVGSVQTSGSGSLPSEAPGSGEKDRDSSVPRPTTGPYTTILESMQVGRWNPHPLLWKPPLTLIAPSSRCWLWTLPPRSLSWVAMF
jgi:regulator-associated protein of mTOR